MTPLYLQIGEATILEVITRFYKQAFADVLIGHFFFNKDHEHLIQQQLTFTLRLLGSDATRYTGKPLRQAHAALPLRDVHFRRRQVLMRETLAAVGVNATLAEQWLALEEALRPQIVNAEQC